MDYKIISKIFSTKIKTIKTPIISCQQTDQEENKRGECSLLSIDFETTFDSIDHKYLFKVLRAIGFKEKFVTLVINALYNEKKIRVLVIGYLSMKIAFQRGVRQEDPISLFMFIIAIEPLDKRLNYYNWVYGIPL